MPILLKWFYVVKGLNCGMLLFIMQLLMVICCILLLIIAQTIDEREAKKSADD